MAADSRRILQASSKRHGHVRPRPRRPPWTNIEALIYILTKPCWLKSGHASIVHVHLCPRATCAYASRNSLHHTLRPMLRNSKRLQGNSGHWKRELRNMQSTCVTHAETLATCSNKSTSNRKTSRLDHSCLVRVVACSRKTTTILDAAADRREFLCGCDAHGDLPARCVILAPQ